MSGTVRPEDLTAHVDESESDQGADPGTYILAATVLALSSHEEARSSIRTLLVPGQRKLHWYDDRGEPRRRKIVEAIAQLECQHIVVVKSGDPAVHPERRRRLCMKQLLWELEQLGVRHACLEARERKQNARDRQLLDQLRASRQVTAELRMDHVPGPEEPLLWIPDAVAGAIVADRLAVPQYRAIISQQIRQIALD
jgi:hypothetical protein